MDAPHSRIKQQMNVGLFGRGDERIFCETRPEAPRVTRDVEGSRTGDTRDPRPVQHVDDNYIKVVGD